MRDFRFLTSTGDLHGANRGLLVQTASSDVLEQAVEKIREMLPEMDLTVLRQREMGEPMTRAEVTYLENSGSKKELIADLRKRSFDVVFVIYSDEGGFWKLKLLPYLLGARTVIVFNENLDSFPASFSRPKPILQHLRWRLESSMTAAPGGTGPLSRHLAKAWLYPVTLGYLVAYERWKHGRAGLGEWKAPVGKQGPASQGAARTTPGAR